MMQILIQGSGRRVKLTQKEVKTLLDASNLLRELELQTTGDPCATFTDGANFLDKARELISESREVTCA